MEAVSQVQTKTTRALDFKNIPADAMTIGIGDNGVKVVFGVSEMESVVTELVAVHMTHLSASRLRDGLIEAISKFEQASKAISD